MNDRRKEYEEWLRTVTQMREFHSDGLWVAAIAPERHLTPDEIASDDQHQEKLQ